jgi:predicted secreted protein
MAYPIHGKVCKITVDSGTNKVAEMSEWTITANLDLDEDTQFEDNWKTYLAGLASWSGSMSGNFDPTDIYQKELLDALVTASPGTAITDARFELEDSGDYFSGSLIITSMEVNPSIAGTVKVTIGFQGTGALSLTII